MHYQQVSPRCVWGGFDPDPTVSLTPRPLTVTYSYLLTYQVSCSVSLPTPGAVRPVAGGPAGRPGDLGPEGAVTHLFSDDPSSPCAGDSAGFSQPSCSTPARAIDRVWLHCSRNPIQSCKCWYRSRRYHGDGMTAFRGFRATSFRQQQHGILIARSRAQSTGPQGCAFPARKTQHLLAVVGQLGALSGGVHPPVCAP